MSENSSEKRADPRSRCLREGKIIFGNGTYVVDCIIDNVSANGAHLRLLGGAPVPREIILVEPSRGVVHRAEVVRRTPKGVGVHFKGPLEDRDAAAAYLRKFRR